MAFQHSGNVYYPITGNSVTLSNVIYTTGAATTAPYLSYSYPAVKPVENGLIPESPEAWLRGRVREVCELAVAA